MISIKKYSNEYLNLWNKFILNSKNGTFLFNRNYMDYHSDRFIDSSLMFFDDNQLCAVFPANRIDDHLYSHQGLTYGGFITDTSMTIVRLIECFQLLIQYMKDSQINQLTYKTIPYI